MDYTTGRRARALRSILSFTFLLSIFAVTHASASCLKRASSALTSEGVLKSSALDQASVSCTSKAAWTCVRALCGGGGDGVERRVDGLERVHAIAATVASMARGERCPYAVAARRRDETRVVASDASCACVARRRRAARREGRIGTPELIPSASCPTGRSRLRRA